MSYDIIRGMRIDGGRVLVKAASNNVFPRDFDECEAPGLSRIFQEGGSAALDLEMMRNYESGNFKSYGGRYVNALRRLRAMPEYAAFDWRVDKGYEENQKARTERRAEFDALLMRALNTRDNLADRRIVRYQGNCYVWKSTRRTLFYTSNVARAKVFFNEDEARRTVGGYSGEKEAYEFLPVPVKVQA